MEDIDATGNIAIGSKALYANTTGFWNTAIGFEALDANTSGEENTAIGYKAMPVNTTGEGNIGIGYNSLYTNTSGNSNVGIGNYALINNISGDCNTAIGASSGSVGGSDNYCTFLGCAASVNSGGVSNLTSIGYDANCWKSNQVLIGNASVTEIGGCADWTLYNPAEKYCFNIHENVAGLDFILRLRPVTYQVDVHQLSAILKEDLGMDQTRNLSPEEPSEIILRSRDEKSLITYTGFIAQEVEKAANSIGFDFSGVDKSEEAAGAPQGLRYASFVVPLVKAVQEQQGIIDRQYAMIEEQRATNEVQQKQIEELLMRMQNLEVK